MRLSPAEARALARRQGTEAGPRGEALPDGVRLWLPGRLRNPLNDRKLSNGWVWDRYKRRWYEAIEQALLLAGRPQVAARTPKRIYLTARVGRRFDSLTDGLRAALKPIPDGLKRAGLIDDDRDSAGHTFVYTQQVDRARPGVEVAVRW